MRTFRFDPQDGTLSPRHKIGVGLVTPGETVDVTDDDAHYCESDPDFTETKANDGPSRDDLAAEATSLGLTFPKNISKPKLAELIAAHSHDAAQLHTELTHLGVAYDPDATLDDLGALLAEAQAAHEAAAEGTDQNDAPDPDAVNPPQEA